MTNLSGKVVLKIRNKTRKTYRRFIKNYRKYNGVVLPPPEMRFMGTKFEDDKYYLDSALHEGERFLNRLNVNSETSLLEVGCSSGRSVIGLIETVGRIKKYVGFDARLANISWCKRFISRNNDWCEFRYIDLWHVMFNRTGVVKVDENFELDCPDNSFDIVYLNSVLPNWGDRDTKIFAKDYFRLLKPGGKLFLTHFIEENVPNVTENPESYGRKYKYPRSIVRYEKNYFLKIFTDVGFILEDFEYGKEIDTQSAVYFSKPLN